MQRFLLWLIVLIGLVIAALLYRSWSENDLNVTPDAAREIEKAKSR